MIGGSSRSGNWGKMKGSEVSQHGRVFLKWLNNIIGMFAGDQRFYKFYSTYEKSDL